MPVIGKLDKQVDEVLISPIKRRRGTEPEVPETAEEHGQAEEAPEPDAGQAGMRTEELPVWLL
jgi:hypothetical protein